MSFRKDWTADGFSLPFPKAEYPLASLGFQAVYTIL